VAGLTADERYRLLQGRVLDVAEKPNSWAFIDASGAKWKPGNYFSLLNRTVSANVARESYQDTLIDEGRDLVQIIGGLSSNSHEACVAWDGRIVSLTGNTPGFPLLSDYTSVGGFHPNCVHTTVYMSDSFKPHQKIIEEQINTPEPSVTGSKPVKLKPVAQTDAP